MPATYENIATTAPTTSPTEITFSNIPGIYTDLVLVMTAKVSSLDDVWARVNGDTGNNYSHTYLTGNGTSASSGRNSNVGTGLLTDFNGAPSTDNNSMTVMHFLNYSNTTTNKTAISRASRAASGTDAVVSLWRSTAAITSITLRVGGQGVKTFDTGTVMTLYGIKAA